MKTAQVVGTLGGGGAQRLVYNLAAGLEAIGVDSDCIALKRAGAELPRGEGMPRIFEVGAGEGGWLKQCGRLLDLRKMLRRENYDIVHVHGSQGLAFVIGAMQGMKRHPKVVFTWHDSEGVLGGRGARERTLRWALRRCDLVTGSSRSVAERLSAGIGRKHVGVFRNGVPCVNATRERESESELRVVWMARFVPPKEPKILVRAVATLARERYRFRVVMAGGAGARFQWLLEETKQLSRALGVDGIIEMPGWVEDPTRLLVMGAAGQTVGVQTSLTEGLSLSLLEMMSAGLAIVATDVGDTSAAIEDGVTGLLIPPGDESALTAALRRVMSDAALRLRLGANARELAVEEFSIHAMARRAETMYGTLMKASGGA